MQSPLARVILCVLSGYILILLVMSAHDWIEREYPSPSNAPRNTARIQHPFHHKQAKMALKRFLELPQSERDKVKANLTENLLTMEQWLRKLDQADPSVICLGELHEETTRNFLAQSFFGKYSADVLMLEASGETLGGIMNRMNAGRRYFPLLEADILNVIRSAMARNPEMVIYGIEETRRQEKEQRGQSGSRDRSIARNFWHVYQPGQRHVILFGALHCACVANWLYDNLRSQAPISLRERMLNVRVLGEHQNGPLEAFVFFLDEIGIVTKTFVIPDTAAMPPLVGELFQALARDSFNTFHTLVVFRS